ncbi:MAG TPA: response regulator transcription factor, partial [Ktedonobacteraceae bacterium]
MTVVDEANNLSRRPSVLIVDDEPQIVDFLQMGFTYEGFQVFTAVNGADAIQSALAHQPDLVVLDIMLPGYDGLEVTRRIRRSSNIAIIMLTAKNDIDDRVTGLDTGADDYLTKPFAFRELMARTRSVLRRHGNDKADVLSFHDITLNRGTRLVTSQDQAIELTPREFDL